MLYYVKLDDDALTGQAGCKGTIHLRFAQDEGRMRTEEYRWLGDEEVAGLLCHDRADLQTGDL